MLIDEIKKANMIALKNHDADARASLSDVISKFLLLKTDPKFSGKEITDGDVVTLIQKSLKELEEEKQSFLDNNRPENVLALDKRIAAIKVFLPQMMSEEEVKAIIGSLEDKSMKNVMAIFKKDYQGKVDMSLVSKIAKSYN